MLQLNRKRYRLGMRSVRASQLFRHASVDSVLEQMRHLADLVIAGVLLVITSPLMVLVALAIKWEGPGPILERQRCITRDGRRFEMLKFRTMVADQERMMPAWARKTTQFGEFLRYTRIESLPQLINVLRGEMNIIDPDGGSPPFFE
jgi:lipopolysaccharide/colanic/teichoic acid biosynthesis glycosyltransferase